MYPWYLQKQTDVVSHITLTAAVAPATPAAQLQGEAAAAAVGGNRAIRGDGIPGVCIAERMVDAGAQHAQGVEIHAGVHRIWLCCLHYCPSGTHQTCLDVSTLPDSCAHPPCDGYWYGALQAHMNGNKYCESAHDQTLALHILTPPLLPCRPAASGAMSRHASWLMHAARTSGRVRQGGSQIPALHMCLLVPSMQGQAAGRLSWLFEPAGLVDLC